MGDILWIPGKFLAAPACSVPQSMRYIPTVLTLNGTNLCPIGLLFGPSTHIRTCEAPTSTSNTLLTPPRPTHMHAHFLAIPKALASSSKFISGVCTVSLLPFLGQFSQGVKDAGTWKRGFWLMTFEHDHLIREIGSYPQALPSMSCSI